MMQAGAATISTRRRCSSRRRCRRLPARTRRSLLRALDYLLDLQHSLLLLGAKI